MRCNDGILLAVEKLVPTKLLVPSAKGASLNRRIAAVDRHVGLVRVGSAGERERDGGDEDGVGRLSSGWAPMGSEKGSIEEWSRMLRSG